MSSLSELKTGISSLWTVKSENGASNATKSTGLATAVTALKAALVETGSTGLDTLARAEVKSALSKCIFSQEMIAGSHNGSAFSITEQNVHADYQLIDEAYALCAVAVTRALIS